MFAFANRSLAHANPDSLDLILQSRYVPIVREQLNGRFMAAAELHTEKRHILNKIPLLCDRSARCCIRLLLWPPACVSSQSRLVWRRIRTEDVRRQGSLSTAGAYTINICFHSEGSEDHDELISICSYVYASWSRKHDTFWNLSKREQEFLQETYRECELLKQIENIMWWIAQAD